MIAISGAPIFDGNTVHHSSAIVVNDGKIARIVDESQIPEIAHHYPVKKGLVAPGYIDLQVNGGGGVLFNESPNVTGIRAICAAHRQFGTTALLATLITDTQETLNLAIQAGIDAERQRIPGFLGLHLEGPHLSREKKGAHEARYIRPMDDASLNAILSAKSHLRHLMVTVAPSAVTPEQISVLTSAGVTISLGHTNATFEEARSAFAAGARCVTHLFNAMSQLNHREPGLVGAALEAGAVHAGLIADGFHVDPAAISIALAAKKSPGRIFLVTDAMSPIGTDMESFHLNDRVIWRKNGRLELEDGTLAGADLDMNSAVMYMKNALNVDLEEAIRMASLYPAGCIGCNATQGLLEPGYDANLLHLDESFAVDRVWINGEECPP